MAGLTGRTPLTPGDLWGGALSRAAVFCVMFMVALAAASYFLPSGNPDNLSLSQEAEKTLVAAVDNTVDVGGDVR